MSPNVRKKIKNIESNIMNGDIMNVHSNVESGIHNVDNTIHKVAHPKKEKVQNIASNIMNDDIMNGDIVDAPHYLHENVSRWQVFAIN